MAAIGVFWACAAEAVPGIVGQIAAAFDTLEGVP
jgi:hypothetical protein